MKREDIPEALAGCDEKLLADALPKQRNGRTQTKGKTFGLRQPLRVALAALALVLTGGVIWSILHDGALPAAPRAKAETLGEAVYPADNEDYNISHGAGRNLADFFGRLLQLSLSDTGTENRLIAPLSTYFSLAMLSETAGGQTQKEILDVLNAESLESLREQAKKVWLANYYDNGSAKCLLGSSLWLRNDYEYKENCIKVLCENYYASAFRGEMGSQEFNDLLRGWINEQTGSRLEESAAKLSLNQNTALALVSTMWLQGRWIQEFDPTENTAGVFHAASGDIDTDYMHGKDFMAGFYEGENFTAYLKKLGGIEAGMLFLLPKAGIAPEDLLKDAEAIALMSGSKMIDEAYIVNAMIPKFDISEDRDLSRIIQDLGVKSAFGEKADFSGLLKTEAFLSAVRQGARVSVDEEGVTAVAYQVEILSGGESSEEKEFILDRPFLFAVRTRDNLPVLAGIVNQP